MDKPCSDCPWTSKAGRDKTALTPEVRAAAKAGQWFCCHVKMGTCYGAKFYGKRSGEVTKRDARNML